MDRYPYAKPPKWWAPRPSRFWVSFWRPIRRREQRRDHRIVRIDVEGIEHVKQAMQAGHGVLVTPNHASHADSYLLLDALLKLRGPSYFMTAWQVFYLMPGWQKLAYAHHGCFSVDREGKDLRAFRQSVKVLADSTSPLVVFPEGEVYHLNDRVMPFRDGTFLIAAAAVKRSRRPVACVPCGLKYFYVNDPTPELRKVVSQIEGRLGIKPARDMPLARRLERLQIETLGWREREYLGAAAASATATPAERRDALVDEILRRLERQFSVNDAGRSPPERAKQLRQHLVETMQLTVTSAEQNAEARAAMEDIFVAVQLYSYDFDYLATLPTIERIAETVDKLEEDVLGLRTARIRGTRRGVVRFGAPLLMESPLDRPSCRKFGGELRVRLQEVLDGFRMPSRISA